MSGTTLVIPAWNEPEAIGAVLDEVPRPTVEHVLVVVGGEDDPTANVARAHDAEVIVPVARGYGRACWTGAQRALELGADVIAFLDGDYSDPPAELPRLIAPIRGGRADLVLGCRDLHKHPDALPLHARMGNAVVLEVMRAVAGRRFVDLPSFKAIRADALRQLDMREMTYGWTVEMLLKAARAGMAIEETQVAYRPRLGGRSKVAGSVRGSVNAACALLGCAVTYATWRPNELAPMVSAASGR